MTTRKGNGRKNGAGLDLLGRRMLKLEREVSATNARLDVTNIRLEHLERLTEQVVQAITGLREDFRGLAAEVRELRLDHARIDRLDERVTRLEGHA